MYQRVYSSDEAISSRSMNRVNAATAMAPDVYRKIPKIGSGM